MTIAGPTGGTIVHELRDVNGSHLTAADKRNIRAIFALPEFDFTEGKTYKANGRKRYRLELVGPERWAVFVTEYETDWAGQRRERTYRSEFTSS